MTKSSKRALNISQWLNGYKLRTNLQKYTCMQRMNSSSVKEGILFWQILEVHPCVYLFAVPMFSARQQTIPLRRSCRAESLRHSSKFWEPLTTEHSRHIGFIGEAAVKPFQFHRSLPTSGIVASCSSQQKHDQNLGSVFEHCDTGFAKHLVQSQLHYCTTALTSPGSCLIYCRCRFLLSIHKTVFITDTRLQLVSLLQS